MTTEEILPVYSPELNRLIEIIKRITIVLNNCALTHLEKQELESILELLNQDA